jgi:hypothetical protein
MDIGTIVSIAGAVAAVSAAIIAIWQANLAKVQAESAKRQARNAEIQTDLMRQQIASTRGSAANEHAKYQIEVLLSYAKAIRSLAVNLYTLLERNDNGRNSDVMELYLEARSRCLASLDKNLVDKAIDINSQVEKNLLDATDEVKSGWTHGFSWTKSKDVSKFLVSKEQAEKILRRYEQKLRNIAADVEKVAEMTVRQSASG